MMSTVIGGIALALYEGGWHPLELPRGEKGPPPTGRTGKGGQDMTRAEVEAGAWIGNLAVRMPIDVIGIDIDAYRGGLDTLAALAEQLGVLPRTCISHSSRDDGSGIRFFRVPVGLHWVSGVPGIDVIQRDHRYAVTYPSVHPDGRTYGLWDQAEGTVADALWAVEDLPELPWPWIEELSRSGGDDTVTKAANAAEVEEFVRTYVRADAPGYIGTIVEHFTEYWRRGHSRHDTMQHCLLWAMECCRAHIASAEPTIAMLYEMWNMALFPESPRRAAFTSPGRVTEFEAMLRHAVGKVKAKPEAEMNKLHDDVAGIRMVGATATAMGAVAPTPVDATGDDPGATQSPMAGNGDTAPLVPVITFKLLPSPFVVPLIEWHAAGLLARSTHGEIAGPEKALKSYTALAITVGLTTGLPVFGRFAVPERQRVSMLVGEGGEGPWLRRLAAMCAAYGVEPHALAEWVMFTTQTAAMTSMRFEDGLRAHLSEFSPALVVLDPYYAYPPQGESSQVTEVGSALERFGGLCREGGATALVVNHYNRKVEAVGLRRITGAGHAEWSDSWLLLEHRAPAQPGIGEYRLRLDVGSRQWGGERYDLDFHIDPLTGATSWAIDVASEEAPDAASNPLTDAKLAVLRAGRKPVTNLPLDPMVRSTWLAQVKMTAQTKRAAFDQLVDEGQIIQTGSARRGTQSVGLYQVAPSE